MACGIEYLFWLNREGYLPAHARLLDVGESCLYYATEAEIRKMWDLYGCNLAPEVYEKTVAEYVMRSNTISSENIQTLFVAELLAVTNLRYSSIDVVSTGFAERFDLNRHQLAPALRNSFDVIVNFGTTEHLINQMNAFNVFHDACKPGGVMFHQVPGTGYLHHGYFCYDIQFFEDLARVNGYDLKDVWYSGPQGADSVLIHGKRHPGVCDRSKPYNDVEAFSAQPIPNSLINVLFQKKTDAPFRVGLELSTAATNTLGNFTSKFIHPVSQSAATEMPLPPIRDLRRTRA